MTERDHWCSEANDWQTLAKLDEIESLLPDVGHNGPVDAVHWAGWIREVLHRPAESK